MSPAAPPALRMVDVRGTRFGAVFTLFGAAMATVLSIVAPVAAIVVASLFAAILLASAWGGSPWSLWGRLYRATLARRLPPPTAEQREPDRPPRFSNLLGGVFLAASALTGLFGTVIVAAGLAGIVAVLAALNAFTGFCLGCRLYGRIVHDGPVVTVLGLK